MIGCFTAAKCLVACLFFDESQHPTCPQVKQSLRWTQPSPDSRHSLQPSPLGLPSRICARCSHGAIMSSGALTVLELGALSDLDDITVGIADVAANLAVLGYR